MRLGGGGALRHLDLGGMYSHSQFIIIKYTYINTPGMNDTIQVQHAH
jgi:hypothetical protein